MTQISWAGGPHMRTTVTWRLEPEGRGTRLFPDHEGFDLTDPFQQMAHRSMGGGWRSGVLRELVALLDAEAVR